MKKSFWEKGANEENIFPYPKGSKLPSVTAVSWQNLSHRRIYETAFGDVLSRENRRYLENVLRLKPRDVFFVTDGQGREAEAVLLKEGRYSFKTPFFPKREPQLEVTITAGISKGNRFELMIEKAVELGVRRIVPLLAARNVVRIPSQAKLARWEKIAIAAMLQCGGCLKPEIADPSPISALPKLGDEELGLLLDENLETSSACLPCPEGQKRVWIASGPEGGFSRDEVKEFLERGWKPMNLGPRRLRAETAPIVALSVILLREKKIE